MIETQLIAWMIDRDRPSVACERARLVALAEARYAHDARRAAAVHPTRPEPRPAFGGSVAAAGCAA